MVSFKPLWLQEKELCSQLLEDKKQLPSLPNDEELFLLLQQIQLHLSQVLQTPKSAIKAPFCLLKDVLVSPALLIHNKEIKIALASCLSEVFRISAPDDPYSMECMQQCLGLRCYAKKVNILEVMEKCQTFKVIFDVECESYILDLFKYCLAYVKGSCCSPTVLSIIVSLLGGIIEESEASLVESFVQLLFNATSTCINAASRSFIDRLLKVCASQLELSLEQLESSFLEKGHNENNQVEQIEDEVALPIVQQIKVKCEAFDVVSLVETVRYKDYIFSIDVEPEIEKLHPLIIELLEKEHKRNLFLKRSDIGFLFLQCFSFVLHFKTRGRVFSNRRRMMENDKENKGIKKFGEYFILGMNINLFLSSHLCLLVEEPMFSTYVCIKLVEEPMFSTYVCVVE